MAQRLQSLYWDENLSQEEIAQRLGLKRDRVKYLMKKLNIPSRSIGQAIRVLGEKTNWARAKAVGKANIKFKLTKEDLEELYLKKGYSQGRIALTEGCHIDSVRRWMEHYGIPRRGRTERIHPQIIHRIVSNDVKKALMEQARQFVCLTPCGEEENGTVIYVPDFVVLKGTSLYALEVEKGPWKKHRERQIEKAKKAGFEGVIFHYYGRSRKPKEESISFRGD